MLIKQGETTKVLFLMVDDTDHITGKTGLAPTVTISKAGAAFGAPAGSVAEVGNGWYAFTPTSADTDTLGALAVHATGTAADPTDKEVQIVAFDPEDADALGLTNLDAAVSSRLASASYDAPDNAGIAAIQAKTDNLPADPASETSVAGVQDDVTAIKAKTDQFVFTVANRVDATATVDESGIAGAVWAYGSRTLTVPLAQLISTAEGSDIDILRGDYRTISITGLGSIAGRTELWFTVKRALSQTDDEALIQINEDEGLVRLNGAAAVDSTWGSITVDDEDAGDITITLKDDLTVLLSPVAGFYYDVQILDASGNALTKTRGGFNVLGDVTRAIDPLP